jgi:hypothetical protein
MREPAKVYWNYPLCIASQLNLFRWLAGMLMNKTVQHYCTYKFACERVGKLCPGPLTPRQRYVTWVRDGGRPFDPWIRVHVRLGDRIGPALPRQCRRQPAPWLLGTSGLDRHGLLGVRSVCISRRSDHRGHRWGMSGRTGPTCGLSITSSVLIAARNGPSEARGQVAWPVGGARRRHHGSAAVRNHWPTRLVKRSRAWDPKAHLNSRLIHTRSPQYG